MLQPSDTQTTSRIDHKRAQPTFYLRASGNMGLFCVITIDSDAYKSLSILLYNTVYTIPIPGGLDTRREIL
jgi:hypothetical protein